MYKPSCIQLAGSEMVTWDVAAWGQGCFRR